MGASMQSAGECPRCKQVNPYTQTHCEFCGDKLPWADAIRAAHQSTAQQQTPAVTPTPAFQLSARLKTPLASALAALVILCMIGTSIFYARNKNPDVDRTESAADSVTANRASPGTGTQKATDVKTGAERPDESSADTSAHPEPPQPVQPPVKPPSPPPAPITRPAAQTYTLTYRVTGVNTYDDTDIHYSDSDYRMVSASNSNDKEITYTTNIKLPWSTTIVVPSDFGAKINVTNRNTDGEINLNDDNSRIRVQILVNGAVVKEDSSSAMVMMEYPLRLIGKF